MTSTAERGTVFDLDRKANRFVGAERADLSALNVFTYCDAAEAYINLVGAPTYPAFYGVGSPFVVVTTNVLSVDQALASTREFERLRQEDRLKYARDLAAVREELAAVRKQLSDAESEPSVEVIFPFSDQGQIDEFVGQVTDAVKGKLADTLKSVTARAVFDDDLGGKLLEVSIAVDSAREDFLKRRRSALEAYAQAAEGLDTSSVVVLVRRSGDC